MSTHRREPVSIGECAARAGVAGNPSDALGGAALAVPVTQLRARVEVRSSAAMTIRAAVPAAPLRSVSSLVSAVGRYGHEGAERLVTAALVRLVAHLRETGQHVDDTPLDIAWCTDVPRSVGLAGSSALAIATIRALADRWGAALAPELVAALAFEAENVELGVAAGWMDRAVQAHDAPVLVETDRFHDVGGRLLPSIAPVAVGADLELVVAWDPAGAAPSGRLHGSLRERAAAGDPEVAAGVERLVVAAHAAAGALGAGDPAALASAVDASCDARAALGALDAATGALVARARSAGGSATSAGSGGAVLVAPRDAPAEAIRSAFDSAGLPALVFRPGVPAVPPQHR